MTWELTPELEDSIIERLSNGEPLRQICRDEGMPSWRTVYRWLEKNESLMSRFARARELGHDAISEECLDIADDSRNDWMQKELDNGRVIDVLNSEHVQRSKLRIETRLKLLAKWNPKKYGERIDLNHGGQKDNQLPPATVIVTSEEGARVYSDMLQRTKPVE